MNNGNVSRQKLTDKLRRGETVSVVLIIAFVALSLAVIFVNPRLYQRGIHEGDIALKDVYAPYDFTYKWEVDREKTREARQEASEKVPYYLKRDETVLDRIYAGVDEFINDLNIDSGKNISLVKKVDNLDKMTAFDLKDEEAKALLEYSDKEKLGREIKQIVENILAPGYVNDEVMSFLQSADLEEVVVYDAVDPEGAAYRLAELYNEDNIEPAIEYNVQGYFEEDRRVRQAVVAFISSHIESNLMLDEDKTEKQRKLASKTVEPIYHVWEVKKNEIIIAKGERANARHTSQLSQLRSFLKQGKTRVFFWGLLLLFFFLGMVSWIYLFSIHKYNYLQNTRDIGIILLNMFILVVISDFVLQLPQPSYSIPVAAMSMMIMLLLGFSAAFISVIVMSLFVAVLAGGKVEIALVLIMGGVVGMYAVKDARRRASILWAGLLAGIAKFFAILCNGLINGIEMDICISDGAWGISSGILSGILVMGILPVFEYVFKVPTKISLLEMSDLNHPLLKRLAMEAPGTYHHSIMVGNLAEAACDSINANSLLARVGSYYHDIGKLSKPQYYNENEMGEKSKHEGLTPSMSALIIIKHVKEGVELARKHKLNNMIIDFIEQHHGNSLIAYFYQKAFKLTKDENAMNEDSFRYPGPKPQTKEAAIVLLADSVEAASRSLEDPTPASIRNQVTKVINNKFIDGQLDECDLTLKDMHKIADSFERVLMGIFHTRTSYPEDKRPDNGVKINGKNKLRKQ